MGMRERIFRNFHFFGAENGGPMSRELRIFVSAASNGLKPYRELVTEVLFSHGIGALVQEYLEQSHDLLISQLEDKILEADAVFCLHGPAYGAPSKIKLQDRFFSWTQYEFIVARDRRKPIYQFFAESAACEDLQPEPDDHQRWQREFVTLAKGTGHGYRKFHNREAFLQLLARFPWETLRHGK